MALLAIDSLDHYNTAFAPKKGWSFNTAGASPGDRGCTIGAYGRNSTNGLRCRQQTGTSDFAQATRSISGVSGTTGVMGFALYLNTSLPSETAGIASFVNSSAKQITITCSSGGALAVRRGGYTGTALGTTVATITHSTWYYIELKVLFDNSAGTYELRIDGVNAVSGTGADTIFSGSAGFDSIILGSEDLTFGIMADYDDLYVCDGSGGVNDTFLGDHRIVCVVASSGNGTNVDWSPSTGSDHGALVDENPANDTDYNQSGTVGHRDTYNFAAVGVAGTVKAVQTANLIKADVAGVRYVGDVTRISSTNYDSTGTTVGSDWVFRCEVHPTSPATATAWTVSEIDGAEFGVKVTA
jgi:hypothetical protein